MSRYLESALAKSSMFGFFSLLCLKMPEFRLAALWRMRL